jgi:hypothetical protein
LVLISLYLPADSSLVAFGEIPRHLVTYEQPIGTTQNCDIFKGKLMVQNRLSVHLILQAEDGHSKEKQVAVKRLKTGHTDTDSRGFHQEIEALKTLGPNKYIVTFVLVFAVDC